ncbi:uncharacterized protein V6R79_019783 [Siganus canaliculatus]
MDVVHVAVTAVYMTDLVNDCDVLGANSCLSNHSVWILSRYFMVVLLLIAALMSIRYLCDPPSEGKLCCMGPLVFVLFVAFASVYVFLTPYIVIILGPVTIGLIFAIIYKTKRRTSEGQHGDTVVGSACCWYENYGYGYGYGWSDGCCGGGDGDGGDCGDGDCDIGDCDIGD